MTRSLYQEYFGISENPFSIIPDPQYLFMSHRHQEALAHLLFGVGEQGGFVLLTGEVGTGKTTVSRALAEQLPENTDMAMILNPRLSDHELMAAICDEMHIEYGDGIVTLKGYFDLLNKHLLDTHAKGRNPVLLIDEAQALPEQGLELVRLLTNLETSKKKLLQIILVGQPELNAILAQPHLRQTTQRITARYHLDALGLVETRNYIAHRLRIAGLNETVFTNRAIRTIHKVSKGIPRLINTICDRALLGAYSTGTRKIGRKLAAQAASEIMGRGGTPSGRSVWLTGALVLGLAGVAIVVAIDPLGQELRSKAVRIVTATLPDIDLSAIRLDTPKMVAEPQLEPQPQPQAKPDPVSQPPTMLDELARDGTPQRAFIRLFELWQQDYTATSGANVCNKAANVGLACLQGQTDVSGLKAMNRPALVSFIMPDSDQIYGVITQIKKSSAEADLTIEFGTRQVTMRPAALAQRWKGDYVVLWRPPEIFSRPISLSSEGPDVVWLRQLLAQAGFGDGPLDGDGKGSPFFGTTLKSKVSAFQTSAGLNSDGIVNPETLLRLSGIVGAINGPSIMWED